MFSFWLNLIVDTPFCTTPFNLHPIRFKEKEIKIIITKKRGQPGEACNARMNFRELKNKVVFVEKFSGHFIISEN